MPFRCEHCQTLSATEDIQCDCKHEQHVVRVAVVHYMSQDGTGRPMSRKRIVNKGEDMELAESVLLRLGCDSDTPSPIASSYLPAVTCLKCLSNFPIQPKPIPIVNEIVEQTLEDYLSEVGETV